MGAVGSLQFDVVTHRLKSEYNVDCQFEPVNVFTVRWVYSETELVLEKFKNKVNSGLALDHAGELVYMSSSRVNQQMIEEKWPEIEFKNTREQVYT